MGLFPHYPPKEKPLPNPLLIKGGSLRSLRTTTTKRLVSSLDSNVLLFKRCLGRPGGVAFFFKEILPNNKRQGAEEEQR